MSESTVDNIKSQKAREAYFTASQSQLIWTRFKANRGAMVAACVLGFMILIGLLAPFLSPYDPTIKGRDKDYQNGPPQIPKFCDENGCSARPFLYTLERTRSIKTNFRWVTEINKEKRRHVEFFVDGWEYKYFNYRINLPGKALDFEIPGFTFTKHLFGASEGSIHIFGTDAQGKDIFSRTLHAIYTSLAVGTIGVFISFVLALIIGGISGYFGGMVDSVIQMFTDAIRTVPAIPLFMALAAFRTHLLVERNQDYVLASKLSGARPGHVIRKHLLPSFTSYIIVDLVISFPYMVLSETALSFIGLGLKDPVNSLGVLLQNVTKADVLLNYQWYFIPVVFFIALVLAFVFVGDGLRDAADPYSEKH